MHYIHDLHNRYGPIVCISPREVDVADVGGFQQIHRIGGGFLKSPWYSRFRTGGINVFNAIDPGVHAVRRKALARPFSKSALRQNWETFTAAKARTAVSKIKQEADSGRADVFKWWTLLTTDIIGKLAFGEDFGMVDLGTVSRRPIFLKPACVRRDSLIPH
jgi:cytochrome P450